MKGTLKLEELLMLALSMYGLYEMEASGWLYLLLALGPDISMLGYLGGNKIGALCYNLFHHKGIAIILFLLGIKLDSDPLFLSGVILFGHSSLDRFFGYGLKYEKGFKYTHLGMIGKNENVES